MLSLSRHTKNILWKITPALLLLTAGAASSTKADGVLTWGSNISGELGNGRSPSRPFCDPVRGLDNIKQVGAGAQHALFLKNDGTVWAIGLNDYGQLGTGSSPYNDLPTKILGLHNITAISTYGDHNMALDSTGHVYTWGAGGEGETGDGTQDDHNTPVLVAGLSGVKSIGCGAKFNLVLKTNGTVFGWGFNLGGQLGNMTPDFSLVPIQAQSITGVARIAVGGYHVLALKSDHTLIAWGDDSVGQLGDNMASGAFSALPVQPAGLTNVKEIAAGRAASMAITQDGTVYAWGYNQSGQLGVGYTGGFNVPVPAWNAFGTTTDNAKIAMGDNHTLVLKDSGYIQSCGVNDQGQLGDDSFSDSLYPVYLRDYTGGNAITDGTDIACGDSISYVLLKNGTVVSAGNNSWEQLCTGKRLYRATPGTVDGLILKQISGGANHFVGVGYDGLAYSWGQNLYGALGNGTTFQNGTPTAIYGLSNLMQVSAKGYSNMALSNDGNVFTWGSNSYGQLGTGDKATHLTPQTIGISNVFQVAMGTTQSYCLKQDTKIFGQGRNYNGCLGYNPNLYPEFLTPTWVNGTNNMVTIAAGDEYGIFLTTNLFVWGLGANGSGQLGLGDAASRFTPTLIGLNHSVDVVCGSNHTLVLLGGDVYSMGDNYFGQLGRTGSPYVPMKVGGLPFINQIFAGNGYSVCVASGGQVYTFGRNTSGQLGRGTMDGGGYVPQVIPNLCGVSNVGCADNAVAVSFREGSGFGGKLELEGIDPSAQAQHALLTFRYPGTTQTVLEVDVTINADGTFHLWGAPQGTWDVRVKADKYLAVAFPNVNTDTIFGVYLTGLLSVGDINNDNRCDLDDLGLLADAFDTVPGDPLWNASADLNGDGVVGLDDLGLLAFNFDTAGAP